MNNNELSKRVAELIGVRVVPNGWYFPHQSVRNRREWSIETAEVQMAFIEWWNKQAMFNAVLIRDDVTYFLQGEGNDIKVHGKTLLEAIRAVVEAME